MKMNRNMMIGGIVAIVVVIILLVVFVLGGGDDEVTSEALTSAFEEYLAGNTDPIKELACEEQHANIDESAAALSGLTGEEGIDVSISCNVEGDAGSCDLTTTIEVEGQDPQESTQTIDFTLQDGKICEDLGAPTP
jgi:hypothetical protein